VPETICAALLAKIHEQVERTHHLIGLLPDSALDWAPPIKGAWTSAVLLGHLLDCLAGFCAALHAVNPSPELVALRHLPVNHHCGKEEARQRLTVYRDRIDEAFTFLRDIDLERNVPTVFVSKGELVITMLLGNLEHLVNHKHQLFTYLKLLQVNVTSEDLYSFR
jgi:hypothetical protein